MGKEPGSVRRDAPDATIRKRQRHCTAPPGGRGSDESGAAGRHSTGSGGQRCIETPPGRTSLGRSGAQPVGTHHPAGSIGTLVTACRPTTPGRPSMRSELRGQKSRVTRYPSLPHRPCASTTPTLCPDPSVVCRVFRTASKMGGQFAGISSRATVRSLAMRWQAWQRKTLASPRCRAHQRLLLQLRRFSRRSNSKQRPSRPTT